MRLHHKIIHPSALTTGQHEQMFNLFLSHYDCVARASFEADLAGKTWVILLMDHTETIRGFSTQEVYERQDQGQPILVLFSGDTIIDPACWGSQELVRGWCAVAARMLQEAGERPCYWFLISKGYRTYLYLPLFFKEYYPQHEGRGARLKPLLDQLASAKFSTDYDSEQGLIRFPIPRGQLGGPLHEIPVARQQDPAVAFFHARNPDFASGVELACLAQISITNTHGIGRRLLAQATSILP